jgi:hypothetical protein
MSRKRFTTMIAVVLLLGAAGLISLYMTLGRMNTMLRSQGRPPAAAEGAQPAGGEKIEQMTLTPAGESQLRAEQERAGKAQAPPAPPSAPPAAAPAAPPPAPAKPAAAPPGASGTPGR